MSSNSATGNSGTSGNKDKDQKKTISMEEWQGKMKDVAVNKEDLNKLVMNYLLIEGYKDAAEKFSQEAAITPKVDLNSIQDRMNIRHAIQAGKIEDAISIVNELDPEILDTNPKLFFHLQQQRLIELIRSGDIQAALEFAQEELAPRGEENPEFLEELERAMALLAFDIGTPSPVGYLLDHSHRQKIASEVNAAILSSQCQDKEAKLPRLIKMLLWAQKTLSEKANFPVMKNLTTGELVDSNSMDLEV